MITLEESKNITLSKNFTLYEFLKSDMALRHNVDNSMPKEFLPRIKYLVDTVLQPVRDKFGPIRILSGYRCNTLAILLGSNIYSNHCYGLAADIEPYDSSVKLTTIMKYIDEELHFKELIAEFFPHGWVHVAAQYGNNKEVVKLKDKTVNYSVVTMNSILHKYSTVV